MVVPVREGTPPFIIYGMGVHLPLPALLSQTLVAFTIEFDNEAEHRLPHWTTNHGPSTGGPVADLRHNPWLVSLVMWTNCMQFVEENGITVGEVMRLARTPTNWNGMKRWGYITVKPDPADKRAKPPHSSWIVRPTPGGRLAQQIWRPLFDEIERRWEKRFGKEIAQLRKSLSELVSQFDYELPDCLPILGYGLLTGVGKPQPLPERGAEAAADPNLAALLSKALLAFAIGFERHSKVSLAIAANVLRLVDSKGVRVRDLPRQAGVSKEAIAMALTFLVKRGYAVVEPESPGTRTKVVRLTLQGQDAKESYYKVVSAVEQRWAARFGENVIGTLRDSLQRLVGEPTKRSRLFEGLEPYPDGWRAAVSRPEVLPHFPMVLHRGGYPDGS